METVAQFAQRVKAKYPEYIDKDDLDLTTRMLKKYPEYRSRVDLSTATLNRDVPTIQKAPTQINQQVNNPQYSEPGFIDNAIGKLKSFSAPMVNEVKQKFESAKQTLDVAAQRNPVAVDIAKSFGKGILSTGEGISGLLSAVGLKAAGKTIQNFSSEVDRKYLKVKDDKALQNQIAQGFGSAATFYVPGMGIGAGAAKMASIAPRIATYLGIGASAVLESGVNAGSVYNEAIQRGVPEQEAQKAAAKVFVTNLPVNAILDRWMFNKLPGGKRLVTAFKAAGQEGAQEGIQQIIQNIALHDPIFKDAPQSAALGAVVGGGIGGAQELLGAPTNQIQAPQIIPETPKVEPQSFNQFQPQDEILQNKIAPQFKPQLPEPVEPINPTPLKLDDGPKTTIGESLGKSVLYNGERGVLKQDDDGTVIFEKGNLIYEIPNVGKDLNKPIESFGMKLFHPKVTVKNLGDTIILDQTPYKFLSINQNKDNNLSVTLQKDNGQKITIRDNNLALDIDIKRNREYTKQQFLDKFPDQELPYKTHDELLSVVNNLEEVHAKQSGITNANDRVPGQPLAASSTGGILGQSKENIAKLESKGVGNPENNQSGSIQDLIQSISKSADPYIDDVKLPLGLSIKEVNQNNKSTSIDVPKSNDPVIDEAWEKARGVDQKTITEKLKQGARRAAASFQAFPHLNYNEDGQTIEYLRQQKESPTVAKFEAKEVLKGILAGMNKDEYSIFSRNIIYPDLIRQTKKNLSQDPTSKIPFGHKSLDEVEFDYEKFKKAAESNPKIVQAIKKRNEFMTELTAKMKEADLLPEGIPNAEEYFHRQVLDKIEEKGLNSGVSSPDLRVKRQGSQQRRILSSEAFNTDYLQPEFEVLSGMLTQLKTKETLDKVLPLNDIRPRLEEEAAKTGKNWENNIPQGYVKWQPEEGSVFYPAQSVSEKIMTEVLKGNRKMTADDFKTIIALGGKKHEWVIPEGLAETLNNFKQNSNDSAISKAAQKINQAWKVQILFNPFHAPKYFLNNLSGDTDFMLNRPGITKHVKRAAKDTWKVTISGKSPEPDVMDAIKRGVFSSGITTKEISDISKDRSFSRLVDQKKNLVQKTAEPAKWYFDKIKKGNEWRENTYRLASYRYFLDKITSGKVDYGASKKEVIDKIGDPKDKAARLAREFLGDYGDLSETGTTLRKYLVPFFSWIELNNKRYFNIIRNLKFDTQPSKKVSSLAASLGYKGAARGAKLFVTLFLFQAIANTWNHLKFPEEEKELGDSKRQLHIILGRDKKTGEIITIRTQGALTDLLSWIGAEDLPHDIADVVSGKSSVTDKLKEAGDAALSKAYGALTPAKSVVEVAAGKSFYPSVLSPRDIRDKGEAVAGVFGMKPAYQMLTGKPSRGAKDRVRSLLTYRSDPGEQAYYDIRNKGYKYLDKMDVPRGGGAPTKKSNALYYYRKSLLYDDKESAKKYLKQFSDLGGTNNDLKNSIKKAAPLGFMNRKYQRGFYSTLSDREIDLLDKATEWYIKMYGKKKTEE